MPKKTKQEQLAEDIAALVGAGTSTQTWLGASIAIRFL